MPVCEANPTELTLDELASRVREAHAASQSSNALDHAFVAGEFLAEIRRRGVPGPWKAWLQGNCLIPASTAALYVQLAKHRAEIETARAKDPDFSLRAARRLIQKPRKAKAQKSTPADLLRAWARATQEERIEFMRRFSALAGIGGKTYQKGSEVLRKGLSLLRIGGDCETAEALAAFRCLATLLAKEGIDQVTITRRHTKERRAA
jgi:hypothetical protein